MCRTRTSLTALQLGKVLDAIADCTAALELDGSYQKACYCMRRRC